MSVARALSRVDPKDHEREKLDDERGQDEVEDGRREIARDEDQRHVLVPLGRLF